MFVVIPYFVTCEAKYSDALHFEHWDRHVLDTENCKRDHERKIDHMHSRRMVFVLCLIMMA